jgi:hypothetical protein
MRQRSWRRMWVRSYCDTEPTASGPTLSKSYPSTTMTITISCSECGRDLGRQQEVMQTTSSETRRLHLRSRLSYLNTLIAALTAERKSLQAESDLIIYPVLSLPTEIIMDIFRRCVPSGSPPRPSPSTSPLAPAFDRTILDSLTLELGLYSRYEPRMSTLFRLQAFAADGMRIKLTMSGKSSSSTRVVFDSGAV